MKKVVFVFSVFCAFSVTAMDGSATYHVRKSTVDNLQPLSVQGASNPQVEDLQVLLRESQENLKCAQNTVRDQQVQIDKLTQEVQAKQREVDEAMKQFGYVINGLEALQRDEDPRDVPLPAGDTFNYRSDGVLDGLQSQDTQKFIEELQALLKETQEDLRRERSTVKTQQIRIDELTQQVELQQREISDLKKDCDYTATKSETLGETVSVPK